MAGAGTATLPGSDWLYLPLLNGEHNAGVLGLKTHITSRSLDRLQLQLLETFASQIAAALERCSLAADGEKIRLQAETERMRNSLLSAVSHDLRTPLATLTGAASILVDRGELLSVDSRKELAESMLDESDRLHRLVQNLLDLTRLEAGAIRLRRELQPIEEVIGVVLHRLGRQLRDHPLQLQVANSLPPVMIDELLMQQVLINLLDNAAKFAPPGTAIELHAEAQGQFLVLEICDHGPGIVPGEEDRIFERFFRGSEQQTSGSGIGLAICRAVIQLHGGTISAQNRSGGGAVIRVALPVEDTTRRIENTEIKDL
jgi:two-component system sensor histidine kinase KdpD